MSSLATTFRVPRPQLVVVARRLARSLRIKGNVITLTTEGLNGVRITGRNKDDALAQAVAKVQGGQNLFL